MVKRSFDDLKVRWLHAYGEAGAAEELQHYKKVKRGRYKVKKSIRQAFRRAKWGKRKTGKLYKKISAYRKYCKVLKRQKSKVAKKYAYLAWYITPEAVATARSFGIDPVSYVKHALRNKSTGAGSLTGPPTMPVIPQTPASGGGGGGGGGGLFSTPSTTVSNVSTSSTLSSAVSTVESGLGWVHDHRSELQTAGMVLGGIAAAGSGVGEAAAAAGAIGSMARNPIVQSALRRIAGI